MDELVNNWIDSGLAKPVVDMIIYTGIKTLAQDSSHWADEWFAYKDCITQMETMDWLTLKATIKKVMLK